MFLEIRIERDRVEGHADIDGGGELRSHSSHALAGRSLTLMRLAFDNQDISAPSLRKVISGAGTHNAAANDHNVSSFHAPLPPGTHCTAPPCVSGSRTRADPVRLRAAEEACTTISPSSQQYRLAMKRMRASYSTFAPRADCRRGRPSLHGSGAAGWCG